jgi:hypothetical protein
MHLWRLLLLGVLFLFERALSTSAAARSILDSELTTVQRNQPEAPQQPVRVHLRALPEQMSWNEFGSRSNHAGQQLQPDSLQPVLVSTVFEPRTISQSLPIAWTPRMLAAIPSTSAPTRPRIVSPSASMASSYFPTRDPFNKGGLRRLRGVGYQPTPVGASPLAPDAPDLYSYSFNHFHQRDLAIIQKMHANVIRLWSFGGENESGEQVSHLHFLNACWARGLFVILTFNPAQGSPKGTWHIPTQPPLGSPAGEEGHESEWARVCARWRHFIRRYQDHPAVLMWMVGNEPNLHSAGSMAEYFKLMDRFSHIRDEECQNSKFNGNETSLASNAGATALPPTDSPYSSSTNRTFSCWHPLSVPMSDAGLASSHALLNLLLPLETHWPRAVDIWSFQVYRGNTFGTFFQQYAAFQAKARTRKPLLLSEFGSDALDMRMDAKGEAAVNQSMQAASILKQWNELEACPPNVCVGGLVFEYIDEW